MHACFKDSGLMAQYSDFISIGLLIKLDTFLFGKSVLSKLLSNMKRQY